MLNIPLFMADQVDRLIGLALERRDKQYSLSNPHKRVIISILHIQMHKITMEVLQ